MLVTDFLVERRKAFKGAGLEIFPLKPLASLVFKGIAKYREALHAYVHKRKKEKTYYLNYIYHFIIIFWTGPHGDAYLL